MTAVATAEERRVWEEGSFRGWTPIGAVQTASGYDVAWKVTGTDEYSVWSTDRNGNYLANNGGVSGSSYALESFEPIFHQDLNGDGVIGLTTTVIQVDGSTNLTKVADHYFLYDGSGAGPSLNIGGGADVAGDFRGWETTSEVVLGTGY